MKRSIDVCRKCEKFCHDDNGMTCLVSNEAMMERWFHFVSENLGIPKDFLFSEEKNVKQSRNSDFEQKDIPEECEMKDVYLVGEWSNEEKV